MVYEVPNKYYFRIHHVRPRFKDDVESVLLYMANKVCKIGIKPKKEFKDKLNSEIYEYPGNAKKALKTVNNWRTEICALFGFFIDDGKNTIPGNIAKLLSQDGDIPEMFNYFLYKFQYPGAHIKSQAIQQQIECHVKFQPAKYILNVLTEAKDKNPDEAYISVAECTHCIFNDLRCTRINHEDYSVTWNRIITNRRQKTIYDTQGDVTRYAKDILDYMSKAGLLNESNGSYYINDLAKENIDKIRNNTQSFTLYDSMIKEGKADIKSINQQKIKWFKYVNSISNVNLATDVFAYMHRSLDNYNKAKETMEKAIANNLTYQNTKQIGDQGEGLVYKYETDYVEDHDRKDLCHLITFIPTQLAVGYDFNSIEPSTELRRFIEVKTTISSSPLVVNSFHMTPNEVRTARTVRQHYFIYRLKVMKNRQPLLTIIKDPISLVEKGEIDGDLTDMSDGLDINYNPQKFKEVSI